LPDIKRSCLKIIFAGTPEFAVPALQQLLTSTHKVIAVLTQPDRPAGRGKKIQASPVKQLAETHQLPIFQPKTLRDHAIQSTLRELNADVMVVVAYGILLPEAVLSIPRLGCVNIHPSLLPRWRGAAPIQRTIAAGDRETGVSIMQLDKGMDTGPVFMVEKIALSGNETSDALQDRLSQLGAALLLKTLNQLAENKIHATAQSAAGITIADKIDKSEAVIDWKQSAIQIERKIRAFYAWPVAQTIFLNQPLKIWQARVSSASSNQSPGTLIAIEKNFFSIAAADGALEILSVQMPGKKRISAADFIRGFSRELQIHQTVFA